MENPVSASKLLLLLFLLGALSACQTNAVDSGRVGALSYDPGGAYPYGRPHPDAPGELQQFAFMIGSNDCREERLNNATGEWVEGFRTWDAYYFINGNAIRDSGRSGAATNGNVRIYDSASQQWQVTYFSTPVYGSGTWSGGMVEDRIELERPQKAPGTDIDGVNRLVFFDISNEGFQWRGEWASLDGSAVFPFWRLQCHKVDS